MFHWQLSYESFLFSDVFLAKKILNIKLATFYQINSGKFYDRKMNNWKYPEKDKTGHVFGLTYFQASGLSNLKVRGLLGTY